MEKRKVVFLKNPKTASSSIEDALSRMKKSKILVGVGIHGHDSASVVRSRSTKSYDNSFVLVSARNPYSRLLSAYQYLVENKQDKPIHQWVFQCKTFKEFCLKIPDKINFLNGKCRFYHRQTNWISLNGTKSYDFLIRYESLQSDWDKFTRNFTNEAIKLSTIRKSTHEKWKSIYDKDMRDIVYRIYENDFDLLKYSKEIK